MTQMETRPAAEVVEWRACTHCRALTYLRRLEREQGVCPECGHHARLSAPERLRTLLDPGSHQPVGTVPVPADPLSFTDLRPYPERLARARASTGMDDAALCVRGTVEGCPVVVVAMDFRFMGGNLGAAVGELVTVAAETALADRVPLVMVTASGGARMQEGILALMQMAKTAQALAALDEASVLTVTVVTDPTYGGVAASFATLSDVILAEPGARMGFAGPRVIEQTVRQRLPDGFQTAEFLLEHGMVDAVHPRSTLRAALARLLRTATTACRPGTSYDPTVIDDPRDLPAREGWDTVALARHSDRPTTLDYFGLVLDEFSELHGDRAFGDCPALVGGLGMLDGMPIVAIGHQKGHDTRELVRRSFGMPRPEGYRKAARLMRLAAKLGLPVLTLVDTPGAYPGTDAEERGQMVAIAETLRLMARLPVPTVAVVTGEGGSGGALALAAADRVLACANSVYSVISPEGCAAILWNDPAAAPTAAAALRMGSADLLRLGVVDGVVPEPPGGAHRDPVRAAELLRDAVRAALVDLVDLVGVGTGELVDRRRQRFRRFGLEDFGGFR